MAGRWLKLRWKVSEGEKDKKKHRGIKETPINLTRMGVWVLYYTSLTVPLFLSDLIESLFLNHQSDWSNAFTYLAHSRPTTIDSPIPKYEESNPI
jgi:hypothetical protein